MSKLSLKNLYDATMDVISECTGNIDENNFQDVKKSFSFLNESSPKSHKIYFNYVKSFIDEYRILEESKIDLNMNIKDDDVFKIYGILCSFFIIAKGKGESILVIRYDQGPFKFNHSFLSN